MAMWVSSTVNSLRISTIMLGFSNLAVVIVGGVLLFLVFPGCELNRITIPVAMVSLAAAFKIFAMFKSGIAQKATALSVIDSPLDSSAIDSINRLQRRMRYKTWLWWSRFALVITLLQILTAIYLVFNVAKYISHDGTSSECQPGTASNGNKWKTKLLISFVIAVCTIPLIHIFVGPAVLRWRSFYQTQDDVWKAHYQEVFDHGIREALCCLGRVKYMRVSKEDEVYSVARLLGDLVAYRASGTGHLELLAGLALLQRHSKSPKSHDGLVEAPREMIQEAFAFHEFAEAAYTGPLLDFGRHTVFFPCAWLYRQGILTPWTRNRRPSLSGDNWWRGHAAAFLKYSNLPPEALRCGRVCQEKCEAAYFVVVLRHLRSVVISVRGTETPEDLITDGLGRECLLSREDLDGLINSSHICSDVKRSVESSFPHYGHSGIVEAARDLYMQLEGNLANNESEGSSGFLSSLLGAGCECDGYSLRIVGHSLGGAIAALLGLRLYRQYPALHVYAYGPLPCVDLVIAEACSEFVTSIVHNNEFSARLSVGSVLRLRAAAIVALAQDSKTDTALIFRLARQFLCVSKNQRGKIEASDPSELHSAASTVDELDHKVWKESDRTNSGGDTDDDNIENPFYDNTSVINSLDDPVSQFLETVPRSENGSAGERAEMFLPGLVIHMVPQQRNISMPLWKGWRFQERVRNYKAYLANRDVFKDIVVSPNMFFDHLPWRCHNAMKKVLESQNDEGMLDVSQIM
ncbi:PREDICTED: sn1-specific diacylglycerol lipase beta isoform X3 [Populus euphratica]|uniref:Sn1-specific diacylglycerol lipase beta isoform X3 n=1 Tax=Populus euphratica TaxID=75702 RepID=A0AAJ6SVY7_POPEU|nr:PREDICTED: sn1-specific diacylglycerol lipase beta isoform X3 [Populus euphratica]